MHDKQEGANYKQEGANWYKNGATLALASHSKQYLPACPRRGTASYSVLATTTSAGRACIHAHLPADFHRLTQRSCSLPSQSLQPYFTKLMGLNKPQHTGPLTTYTDRAHAHRPCMHS